MPVSTETHFRQAKHTRPSGSLDILTYHAVTPSEPPLGDWCFLSQKKFMAQMKTLHRLGARVLPLADAASALLEGKLSGRCVAITFDDGYRNNVTAALPILEQFGFPATVFLVTGLVGEKKTLWPNRIIAAVQETRRERIEFRGHRYQLGSAEERRKASRELQHVVKRTSGADPNAASREIEIACGTPVDPEFEKDDNFSMLDLESVRKASRTGLIEFGGHTVTHPILSKLSCRELNKEILGSVSGVEELAERPCRTFAYPNGAPQDFDVRAVNLLATTNVRFAVTTVQARNQSNGDPYRLTRWDVGSDISLARFVATVSGLQPIFKKLYQPIARKS
jgi:peptidoglycan/xylan/chitin deacetylase (PgdA/CDA1 family)